MTTPPTNSDRWAAVGFRPPEADPVEPDQPVTVDYLHDGRIGVITLNRPAADNAITTEMGALLTEIVESIAIRSEVRVVILTGAGNRAFSVGSDLRQRKAVTKQDWLRQRQDFDRTLYTVRQLRKPILAAVNGAAYGGGSELAQSTDFILIHTSGVASPSTRGGMTWSAVPIGAHDGMVRQAGIPDFSDPALSAMGR